MKNRLPLLALFVLLAQVAFCTNYYVDPDGDDSNSGTSSSPFATLEKAIEEVSAGDYIYLRGGTYSHSSTIVIDRDDVNGTSSNPITVAAYNDEVPILDFSSLSTGSSNRGIVMDASYWHWIGITIQGAGDNGMLLSGNNNTIENCIFKENRDTGLQLSRYHGDYDDISEWPTDNLITGCESYDNADPDYEDADGFAAKLTCGEGNQFINCVSHHNIDDGWDLYTKSDTGPIGEVYFEGCIAHNNGTLTDGSTSGNGDKNGYKLGSSSNTVDHKLVRCIAFNNGKHGFTDNGNIGSIQFINCTSYNNTQYNFHTRDNATHIFINNLSYASNSNDRIVGDATAPNAFDNDDSWPYTASSSDFETLTPGSDSDPTANGFLSLTEDSDLIDAGDLTDGVSYTGSAPDLGALEYGESDDETDPSITLTASAGDATVDLSWTISGVTVSALEVYRDTDSDPADRVRIASVSSDTRSYTDNTVTNETTYYYWIKVNATYNSDAASATPSASSSDNSTLRIEDTDDGTISYDGSLKSYTNADNGTAINLSNSEGKQIVWNYSASTAGTYTLTIRYTRKASMNSSVDIIVNDGSAQTLSLSETTSTTFSTASLTATLSAGTNAIVLETNASGESADIDWIEITSGSSARIADLKLDSETSADNSVSIYPNPSTDFITVTGSDANQQSSVKMYNMQGKVVIATIQFQGAATLSVNQLPKGMYVIEVAEAKGSTHRQKIIVR